MIHTDQHGFLGHWQVPWVLLFIVVVVGVYGRYESQRLEGSMMLALSAYLASTVLSIVALAYVLMLPVQLKACHEAWDTMALVDWSLLILCSAMLTWVGWVGIRKMSGDL